MEASTEGAEPGPRLDDRQSVATLLSENERLKAELAVRDELIARLGAAAAPEARIRTVADSLPVLIAYVDSEQRYRFNNKAYESWFGDDRASILGRHLREVLGEAAYADLRPLVETALAGKRVSADREIAYRKGGTRHVHIEYVPDPAADGRISGFFALVQDVTERSRSEQALRESEARFRAMADCAPAPVWVTNREGIEFANQAFAEVAGLPREQLTGEVWMQIIHPDDLGVVLLRRAEAWTSQSDYSYEARFRRANGDWRYMQVNCRARLDESGGLIGYVGMAVDLTEQKKAEAELRESEARFRAMADSAPAPVWVTNAGGIEFANRALSDFTGLDVKDLLGPVWMSLVHPDDLKSVAAKRDEAWARRESYDFEARFRRADGEWRWLHAICKPRGSEPEFLGYVGMATDVTDARRAEEALRDLNQSLEERIAHAIAEREQAEEALRQAQKMEAVGQLTGGIAHDFNNLLTVIIGNVDAARRRLGSDAEPRVSRALDNAMVGAERAAVLTQRLLAFSRRQPLNPRPVDANRLVNAMSELLHRTLGETISIDCRLSSFLWSIEADPHQLENALLNLAVNARDAMETGGRLVIETANVQLECEDIGRDDEVPPGDYVLLRVSDTGCGMGPETAARAIEPFFTTKEVGRGTGLGLSMVYGFVKQSGGLLRLESEEGEGTTVSIYLPRLEQDSEVEKAAARDVVSSSGREETIVVCEDDDDVRAYTVELLDELGYRVLQANDGPSALKLLERPALEVDLLFTDVVLPNGMTGDVLAEQARKLRPGLKILFTTGYARDSIVHDGRLDPGLELITKPFTFAELAARLRSMLDPS